MGPHQGPSWPSRAEERSNAASSDSYVVIAARREVEQHEERFFLDRGVQEGRVFDSSNCFNSQFGVSGGGCIGEAR